MQPLQYAIYKGKTGKWGAIQFQLKPPVLKEGAKYPDEGCVFVSISNASAPDVYDWDNKMVIALGVTDLGKLLLGLRTGLDVKIFHDPQMGSDSQGQITKSLNFSSPSGLEKGFLINGNYKKGDTAIKYLVPMTPDEVTVLGSLVAAAIPGCLGW